MVVRIRVRLKPLKGRSGEAIETSALANTGYESIVPEVLIPARLARRLGFLPRLPKGARRETFMSTIGRARMRLIPDALEVTVAAGDREVGPVKAGVVIAERESEVLLGDKLIEGLKLDIFRPGSGLWRFSDDKPETVRESIPPEEW